MGLRVMGALAMAVALVTTWGCQDGVHAAELPRAAVDLPAPKPGELRTVVLAGGCFWCVEAVFEQVEGVTEVVSGFAGGTPETATYEQVSSGKTLHAEVVRITYDPSRVSLGELLRIFFATHDPTTKDRQGPDWGHQYRSAIFYDGEEQRKVAAAYLEQLGKARVFGSPVVTTLEPLKGFYPAEGYHQDFVRLHPDHPYVQQWSVPKIRKLREGFPERIKKATASQR
ncbi:MAG: peptide-methionine (S)-S-oxide reductase MsrA [Myxococcota bacterium]